MVDEDVPPSPLSFLLLSFLLPLPLPFLGMMSFSFSLGQDDKDDKDSPLSDECSSCGSSFVVGDVDVVVVKSRDVIG